MKIAQRTVIPETGKHEKMPKNQATWLDGLYLSDHRQVERGVVAEI